MKRVLWCLFALAALREISSPLYAEAVDYLKRVRD
jgi:hypothetical protein